MSHSIAFHCIPGPCAKGEDIALAGALRAASCWWKAIDSAVPQRVYCEQHRKKMEAYYLVSEI